MFKVLIQKYFNYGCNIEYALKWIGKEINYRILEGEKRQSNVLECKSKNLLTLCIRCTGTDKGMGKNTGTQTFFKKFYGTIHQ